MCEPDRQGTNVNEWHRHFQTFFEYIDIQKIRTPKGLDWLKAQYPELTQNELMFEMQGIRMMHCTIWTEGVREIVSAQDADVKFIITSKSFEINKIQCLPHQNHSIVFFDVLALVSNLNRLPTSTWLLSSARDQPRS